MGIVEDFSQCYRQYYMGSWYKKNSKRPIKVPYSIDTDRDKSYYQPVPNLNSELEKLIIQTTKKLDYKEQDLFKTTDGVEWIIDKINENKTDINEQSLDFFEDNTDTLISLYLTRVCSED